MPPFFVNLDAQFLAELSAKLADSDNHTAARLIAIADNLQRMDERSTSAYSQGFAEGEDAWKRQNSNIHKKNGPANLEEALKIWKGEVSRVPQVTKENHKSVLTAADLDFDEDFEQYLEAAEQEVRKKNDSSRVRNKVQAKHS